MSSSLYKYIPETRLSNLKKYKYQGIDKSLLSRYVLQPYWSYVVTLFPSWMAPNMITFLGFLMIIINLLTVMYFDPSLSQPSPRWAYFSYAAGLWIYATFDAIDGKQARRTNTLGPLGELFDHGCDALNTTLGVIITSSALGIGQTWWTILCLAGTLCNFYLSTWEEFHTGALYLGHFSGPIEGLVGLVLVFIFTGIKGSSFWSQNYKQLLGGPHSYFKLLPDIQINHLFIIFSSLIVLGNIFSSVRNVAKSCKKDNKPLLKPLLGLIPFFVTSFGAYLWVYSSPNLLSPAAATKFYFPFSYLFIPFMLFIGFSFGYTVGLIIVAHISDGPFPFINICQLAIFAGGIHSYFRNLNQLQVWSEKTEIKIVWLYFIFALAIYTQFALSVIRQICDYLDIYCLSIKKEKSKSY